MARIAGVDLPRNKHVRIALTYIYGIGNSRSDTILSAAHVEPAKKVSDLNEDEVNRIRQIIEEQGNVEGDRNRFLSWVSSSPQPSGSRPAYPYQRPHPQGSAQGHGSQQEESDSEDVARQENREYG